MANLEQAPGAGSGSAPQEGKRERGLLSNIFGVFVEPKATFEAVSAKLNEPHPSDPAKTVDKSKWWIPVLIVVVISVGVAVYTVPTIVMPQQVEIIRDSVVERGGTPEQADEAVRMARAFGIPWAIFGAAAGTFIILFVVAGVLHLLAKMVGGKGRFRNARMVASYSLLVTALGSLVKLPLMVAKKTLAVETGPTLFFPALEPSDRLYRFLSSFDIFTIWWVALLIVGLAIAYRIKASRAAIAVVILWVIIAILTTLTPMGGGFGVS
jgi:hypothetical protein